MEEEASTSPSIPYTTSAPSPPVGSPSVSPVSVSSVDLFEHAVHRDVDQTIGPDDQNFSSYTEVEKDMVSVEASPAELAKTNSAVVGVSSTDALAKVIPVGDFPEVPVDLLHLVDSAIVGVKESVERLREMVVVGENVARSVVEALIESMGGVKGLEESGTGRGEDVSPPSVMRNPRAAVVAAELIPWLPCHGDSDEWMSSRTRISKALLCVLQGCTRSRAMCYSSGVLGVMLRSAEKVFVGSDGTDDWDGTPLCQCIEVLAGHSTSVSDLHFWLSLVKKTITTRWALRLMLALEKAIGGEESRGPKCTFAFDGQSSGLLAPGENRWPFSNGYGFATWIYVESFENTISTAEATATTGAAAAASSSKSSPVSAAAAAAVTLLSGEVTAHMPRLFSFLSPDNVGVEAYFHGHSLVVECAGGKGKKASLYFAYAFKPKNWYFIGLEHTSKQGLLGKTESELRLYVDGCLHESRPFEFPRVAKPMAFCCTGTTPHPITAASQRHHYPLFAEMGPVYIFKEPIGLERMERLAVRGGDALPCFGNGSGFPCMGVNAEMRSKADESFMLDAEIGASLLFLYHPRLLSGRFCADASPFGTSVAHGRHAEILGQVYITARVRATESLWALAYGGPLALLPLAVSYVQEESLEPILGDLYISTAASQLSLPIFRIISMLVRHPGNNEDIRRTHSPEVLSLVLHHLLQTLSTAVAGKQTDLSDEELVGAVISICQSQKENYGLKVELFSTLLLDLKLWSICKYSLQKKLLSSLADMAFAETSAMRDANALQKLLDGCMMCYCILHDDSGNTFLLNDVTRHIDEVNELVDELLVVIELLIGAGSPSSVTDDIHQLIGFLVDCPQPNQVARVLHLIYRLVVQPNALRARLFAESFISCGGIEVLILILQREVKAGNYNILQNSESETSTEVKNHCGNSQMHVENKSREEEPLSVSSCEYSTKAIALTNESTHSSCKSKILKDLGDKSFSTSSARNMYNAENGDAVVVGILNLLSALVISGHLKLGSPIISSNNSSSVLDNEVTEVSDTMFSDKVSLLLFALQKTLQAAPQRLMTTNVYMTLLGATMNVSSADDALNLYDSNHRFEHLQLLLVLLRSLPYASRPFQVRAIQDLLFLVCSHDENRNRLSCMEEWPEWILEVLISNYEMGSRRHSNGPRVGDIEDLIHNFLINVLEYSMRQKDGWKDVEATIHCAEWLCSIGGSTSRDIRIRREQSLPIFKRRLLGGMLDFVSRELQVQHQVIAAVSDGVAAEGLSSQETKTEAEGAAQLSMILAENAIVILMLVEDHLRLQTQLYATSHQIDGSQSPVSFTSTAISRSNSLGLSAGRWSDISVSIKNSISSDFAGLQMDDLNSMSDEHGEIFALAMERLTAAAAAEPYESVRCAFVSYGSCSSDLAEGWKYRSSLWYGFGHAPKAGVFGGGGSGWESWKYALEKDSKDNWIELPLIKKSIAMLEILLLDESGVGSKLGVGGVSGTAIGETAEIYQLLNSDQPFFCMLRIVLVFLRENNNREDDIFIRYIGAKEDSSEGFLWQAENVIPADEHNHMSTSKRLTALLWSVLAPILNMPISESKRQRVLVTLCILYAEVWGAIGKDRNPLRPQYLEAILPPFIAILRRWRPILAGIHELTSSDAQNPFIVDDIALSADMLPLEGALSMISPEWAAAFASPPAAMALAMMAAGATGGEAVPPLKMPAVKRDISLRETRISRLFTFASFQKPPDSAKSLALVPKEKEAIKAAATAAAQDLERLSRIGTGRGLSAVAMATSAQRRVLSDTNRTNRWNVSEAMGTAWMECLQSLDAKLLSGKDFSALACKYVAVLFASSALTRNMKKSEMDRRGQDDILSHHRDNVGRYTWRKLIHCLLEMNCLFSTFADCLCNSKQVSWKLDVNENSSRMRRCFKRNYEGSDHSGSGANYADDHLQYEAEDTNESLTSDNEASAEANLPSTSSVLTEEEIHVEESYEDCEPIETDIVYDNTDSQQNKISDIAEQNFQDWEHDFDGSIEQNLVRTESAKAAGYTAGEFDEGVMLELSASIVRPLKVVKGTFQITSKRIDFIVDKYNGKNNSGEELPSTCSKREWEKDRSWSLSSLHKIFSRRYLLRRSALELFMVDHSNIFFDFGSLEGCRTAYHAIIRARPPHLNNTYLSTLRPDQLLERTQLMERWSRWEISNFEYLMELNTLAGRSYNDITQYPVFPWILTDYKSTKLDLGNPLTYRDLSKPIGALNEDRLKRFQERYTNFEDPVIPKFHYGSHYSSAGSVLYYLVRVEPYTTLSLQLQGGKFDHADRMFSHMGATWDSVLEDMNDVKELIPELFYLPEVLTKGNSTNFGTTEHGEKIDTVKLPPWAETPVDFIRKHRMALESEHVSAHLHEWIDLIFGYKQRGKEAVSAKNIFFYITYEGTVDIDKISDPVQQRAMQDQIAYFGQTPSQLLRVPHLKKQPLENILHLQTIFRNPNVINKYVVPNPERCNVPAAAISAYQDSIIVIDVKAPAANVALHKWQPNTPGGHGTPFLFQHGRAATNSAGGSFMRMFKGSSGPTADDWQFPQASAFATSGIISSAIVAITCEKDVITGGHADNSIKLISSDGAKTIETAAGHCAPVTCVALSRDSNYLVTGSRDTTIILWRIHVASSSQLSNISDIPLSSAILPSSSITDGSSINSPLGNSLSLRRRIEGPIHVIRGHLGEIVCCAVCSDLGIIASSSLTSGVLVHSLKKGRFIRKLDVIEAQAVCLSPQGVILTWSAAEHKLCTFTINGIPIATAILRPFSGRITCMEVSIDGENLLIGTASEQDKENTAAKTIERELDRDKESDLTLNSSTVVSNQMSLPVPSVCFLNMHTLKVFYEVSFEEGQDITAIALSKDDTSLLVSTADKQLIVFTDPVLSSRAVNQTSHLGMGR